MICPGCFKEHAEGFCHSCLRELFGGKKNQSTITFQPALCGETGNFFKPHQADISFRRTG